jgi:glycosyltransferase involved in cell wall biosynthesis
MEPTSYKVGLIEEVRREWGGSVDILYVGNNLSQDWGFQIENARDGFLPASASGAVKRVYRRLKSGKYGLLHLAGWGHPVLAGSLLSAAWLGIPVVMDTDTPLAAKTAGWKDVVKRLTYPAMFRLPNMFLPAGSRQAEYLRHYKVSKERIRLGMMTSDVKRILAFSSQFTETEKEAALRRYGIEDSGRTRFLFLGRLQPHKGLGNLMNAFHQLAKRRNDVDLLIAGSGPLENWVRDMAARNTRIHYLGHLRGEKVWEAYALANVFVLPSHFEPWGLVVNEAMAAGLPVIVSDRVGCIDDLVGDNVSGLVVKAESATSLLQAMDRLAADALLRQKMAGEARRTIAGWTLQNQASIMVQAWTAVSS